MSDNLTLVHRSKIKWNLATSTEFPIQYIKQHDFSLKNEPPFCLHFLMNHHLCIKPLVTIADAKCPTFLVMSNKLRGALSHAFNIGVRFANFHSEGTTPWDSDKLNSLHRDGAILVDTF